MAINIKQIRQKIIQKSKTNPAILNELHLKHADDVSKISDTQLESLLSPKMMGLLNIHKEDVEKHEDMEK